MSYSLGFFPSTNRLFAGSDGDHYTILWDNCLLIPRTVDPMDYTGTAPVRVDRVTIQHTKKVRDYYK